MSGRGKVATYLSMFAAALGALSMAPASHAQQTDPTPVACGELVRPPMRAANTINELSVVGGSDEDGVAAIWDASTGELTRIGVLGHPDFHGSAIYDYSQVVGLNERGQAVGYSFTPVDPVRGFIWSRATGMEELVGVEHPRDINNAGQVVGGYDPSHSGTTQSRAFLWTRRSGVTDLGLLPGCNSGVAVAINEAGIVVGTNDCEGGNVHAFVWYPGHGLEDLGSLHGNRTQAGAIDNFGRIVGGANDGHARFHLYRWHPFTGFRTLADAYFVQASGSNDLGAIVGVYQYAEGALPRPYLYTARDGLRQIEVPGLLPQASDVNARGWVVGHVAPTARSYVAYLFKPCR
jgi:probable HAF family extracellular repeat protein